MDNPQPLKRLKARSHRALAIGLWLAFLTGCSTQAQPDYGIGRTYVPHETAIGQSPSEPPLTSDAPRSEEHTSELQSRPHLVCRLLLEKKKNKQNQRASQRHT